MIIGKYIKGSYSSTKIIILPDASWKKDNSSLYQKEGKDEIYAAKWVHVYLLGSNDLHPVLFQLKFRIKNNDSSYG